MIASAAFPATTQLANPATTASSSNHRNPKSSLDSGTIGFDYGDRTVLQQFHRKRWRVLDLIGCTASFLTSSASEELTALAYQTNPRSLKPVYKYYTMDGLSATTSILADDGLVYSTFRELEWCNGNSSEGIPVVGPC